MSKDTSAPISASAKCPDCGLDGPFRANLCNPNRVLTDERNPSQEFRFTCADKADNKTTWACTGSEHKYGSHTICICTCHANPPALDRYGRLSTLCQERAICIRMAGHDGDHQWAPDTGDGT